MTRVVFLDAEGTIYVNKNGKEYSDFWNGGEHTVARALDHFELNEGVVETLEKLKEKGLLLVVVSKHKPELLPDLLDQLGAGGYFSDTIINGDKGERMAAFLEQRKIPKKNALVVGDKVKIDIEPAERVGIKGLLLGGPELGEFRELVGKSEGLLGRERR